MRLKEEDDVPYDLHKPHNGKIDNARNRSLKYDVLSDKTVTLNKVKAEEYVELPIFEGERPVSDQHVQTLYDHMRANTFNFSAVTLASAHLGDVRYKINGQHTCWAAYYMPDSLQVQVREIVYRVNNLDALKSLYSSYDAGKPRTKGHLVHVMLSGKDFVQDLSQRDIGAIASGLRLWLYPSDRDQRRLTAIQLATTIEKDYAELFATVSQAYVLAYRENKDMRRLSVAGAMCATYAKAVKASEEFWNGVSIGFGITGPTDPRHQLRKTLARVVFSGTKNRSLTGQLLASDEQIYSLCVHAWNKWRAGEEMVQALRAPKSRPVPK